MIGTRTDKAVLDYLTTSNSLLDSKLVSLQVAECDGGMEIEMRFAARPSASNSRLTLKFREVIEFGFYFSSEFVFYNVEQIKFEATASGCFYLSLDPDMNCCLLYTSDAADE